MVLDKAALLKFSQGAEKRYIKTLKDDVYIRMVTVGELEQFSQNEKDLHKLLAFVLSDEVGKRLFTFEEAEGLKDWPVAVANEIIAEALKVNKLGTEEVKGNSEPVQI